MISVFKVMVVDNGPRYGSMFLIPSTHDTTEYEKMSSEFNRSLYKNKLCAFSSRAPLSAYDF